MVFNPPVAKECKYCGRGLDKDYAEIGVCPYCLDQDSIDEDFLLQDNLMYVEEGY